MRKIAFLILAFVLAVGFTVPLQAQSNITFTTLSSAVSAGSNTLRVTSATGFTVSTGTQQYIVFVDHEAMLITGVSGTTITVQRGQGASTQTAHNSGAYAFVGARGSVTAGSVTAGPFVDSTPVGTCTRGGVATLPLVNIRTGQMVNCLGGQWYVQTLPDDLPVTPLVQCNVPMGSVAYGSLGTNTTDIDGKMMRSTIMVPKTTIFTGIQVLQGGTATTDNITAALFDQAGRLLVSTAAAGTLLATADSFKAIAFALNASGGTQTTTVVTGPARYWIGVTGNGTAAGAYRTIAASTFKDVLTGSATGQTFGTFPAFTPTTTFTADVGPIACLYN